MFPLPWLCTASTGLCSTPCSGKEILVWSSCWWWLQCYITCWLLWPCIDHYSKSSGSNLYGRKATSAHLKTLGEHKQHANNQIWKGKHKIWKPKVLFKHRQKQLLTICSWLLKQNISLQTAVMPVKGTHSFIILGVKDQGLDFPLTTEQSLP